MRRNSGACDNTDIVRACGRGEHPDTVQCSEDRAPSAAVAAQVRAVDPNLTSLAALLKEGGRPAGIGDYGGWVLGGERPGWMGGARTGLLSTRAPGPEGHGERSQACQLITFEKA